MGVVVLLLLSALSVRGNKQHHHAGDGGGADGDLLAAERVNVNNAHLDRTSLEAEIAARRSALKQPPSAWRSGRPRRRQSGPYYVYERLAFDADLSSLTAARAEIERLRDNALALYAGYTSNTEDLATLMKNGVRRVFRGRGRDNEPVGDAIAERLVAAVWGDSKLLRFGFAGHSAAAGHGNYFNESFPMAFLEFVGPALAQLGVETQVGNFALGGTHSRPHPTWCMSTVMGKGLDFVGWDFDMTETNDPSAANAFALGVKTLSKKPPILLFKGGGGERGVATNAALEAAKALPVVLKFEQGATAKKHPFADLTERSLDKNAGCAKPVVAPTGEACDSNRFHPQGRCSSQVKWHPGWNAHQLSGLVIALPWLEAALAATDRALAVVAAGKRGGDVKSALLAAFVSPLEPETPPPPPRFYSAEVARGMSCATQYAPRAGQGVADLVSSGNRAEVLSHPAQKQAEGIEPDGCGQGPVDARGAVAVVAAFGWVAFTLENPRAGGLLLICEPATGWNRARNTVPLDDASVEWRLGGSELKLRHIKGNNHLQRCFETRIPKMTTEQQLQMRCADCAAHLQVRVSQVAWESTNDTI